MKISRKKFISDSLVLTAGSFLLQSFIRDDEMVMTVNGPLPSQKMGFTLTHEHIMADFIGADKFSRDRYNPDKVVQIALPFIKDIKAMGVNTFIDCGPVYLGRDVHILKRISDMTGMNIMTPTGYYGAVNEKFVPAHAYNENARQLADRWISEWNNGIEGTTIKPGLIKTSTDKGPLTPMQRKLIEAAGIAHLETGLTIAIHTGDGAAAFEQLDILKKLGVAPAAKIWVHAQLEPDSEMHIRAAKLNGWVSFDGVNPDTLQDNLIYLKLMKTNGLLGRVLVSQDSGWYHVGEPNGGTFKPYNCISTQFIPLLQQNGFTSTELDDIFKTNPAKAFSIRIRKY